MGDARLRPLEVAALTLGQSTPSARFRVRQFVPPLRALGVEVREHAPPTRSPRLHPGTARRKASVAGALALRALDRLPHIVASQRADLTWLSKQLVVGLPTFEPLLRRPLVLDVDDAVWLANPLGHAAASAAARCASAVVTGNAFLANWYYQFNRAVHLVPTSVDTERFRVAPPRTGAFTVGWTGSASTLPFLSLAEPGLARFLARRPEARLLVLCDARPTLPRIRPEQLEFLPWSPETELAGLERMSVGLMPLPDNELARGKCSFKMLQYMATGLPVVVSPYGTNAELLGQASVGFGCTTDDEWAEALEACADDPAACGQLGAEGRALVEREYSVAVSATKLARIFRSL